MWEELQRLRKENQKLKLHQEILKKRWGILSDRPQRYALIQLMAQHYSIKDVCHVLRVPRSAYYAWLNRRPSQRAADNQQLREKLATLSRVCASVCRRKASPVAATVWPATCAPCTSKPNGPSNPKPPMPTIPIPSPPTGPGGRSPQGLNRVWVGDITYISTAQGWLYLAAVMDLYSRKIIGWATSDSLETPLVKAALQQALTDRRPAAGLLHHSDRGSQYASSAYRALLHSSRLCPSMSAAGNCYDNAAMESFWSTLKTEWLHHKNFPTHQAACSAVFDYIETFYNPTRLHSALGYQSPVDFERITTHE